MKWETLRKIGISGLGGYGAGNHDLVTQYLDQYIRKNWRWTKDVILITDGSVGVTNAIEVYATRRGIKNLVVHAQWLELQHEAAWKRRNNQIISLSDECFAFWDKKNPGTKHFIERARLKGKPIKVISPTKLHKLLHVPKAKIIRLPATASKRDGHSIRELIEAANLSELDYVNPKKKRRRQYFDN